MDQCFLEHDGCGLRLQGLVSVIDSLLAVWEDSYDEIYSSGNVTTDGCRLKLGNIKSEE